LTSPVDAAALVDQLEVAQLALAERAERRHRAATGHGLADADFGGGDAAGGWAASGVIDRLTAIAAQASGGSRGIFSSRFADLVCDRAAPT
jgi:hypothetical protein